MPCIYQLEPSDKTPHFIFAISMGSAVIYIFKSLLLRGSQCFKVTEIIVLLNFIPNRDTVWIARSYRTPQIADCLAIKAFYRRRLRKGPLESP
ncbi:Activating Signal Cointegrator 1 [Manis pentadactyla]|nr:Activating Signal Cointegrator 1 [Manis pentadactyla]